MPGQRKDFKRLMRRPCKVCDKMFLPNGKFQKLCEKCQLKAMKQAKISYRLKLKQRKDLNKPNTKN